MTGKEIETWIDTREQDGGQSMTATFAASNSGVNRTTLWRWIQQSDSELRPNRTLRDFVEWMRGYDSANRARRTKGAPRTPEPLRL